MEDNSNQSFFEKASNWLRNSITIRLFTIGILILILLIPVSMIEGLIHERENRQEEAQKEISEKWGHRQTVKGPVLTVPYDVYEKIYDKNEASQYRMVSTTHYAHFLPEKLNMKGSLLPEVRYRGIYEVIIYSTNIELSGFFLSPDMNEKEINKTLRWNDAFIAIGISDLRSIKEAVKLSWNNKEYSFEPGVITNDVIGSGISVPVSVEPAVVNGTSQYTFNVNLKFNGSSNLSFIPLGRSTEIKLASAWKNPKFDGAFLPDSREVNEKGFSANWKVLNLNRSYPQQFSGTINGIDESAFGVSLLMPVDQYQKSMRAAKYAVLFIALTFMVFFFLQVIHKVRIHPFQYILVGLALCIFYTLLISFSEHIYFGLAYLVSSASIVLLITFYAQGTFRNIKLSGMLASILIILYGFIYIIIQLEDFALLTGSIGLFIALGFVMILTRKIDWYGNKEFVNRGK